MSGRLLDNTPHSRRKRLRRALACRLEPLEGRMLLSAGGLDPAFANHGYALTSVRDPAHYVPNDGVDVATAATALNGQVVVAGTADANSAIAVVRYNPDGSRDYTFGQSGQSLVHYGDMKLALATSVLVQLDGRILVAGAVARDGGNFQGIIARLNTDGTLDSGFGNNGILVAEDTADDYAYSAVSRIMLQPDGRIVAAGRAGDASQASEDWTIARFNADGSTDTGFGTGGWTIVDLGGMDQPIDMAQQADGRVIVVGASEQQAGGSNWINTGFWAARLNTDGSLDAAFGGSGVAHYSPGDAAFAARVGIAPDGGIIMAGPIVGTAGSATPSSIALTRLNADGTQDNGFGSGGWTISNGLQSVLGLHVADDGSSTIAGYSSLVNSRGIETATLTIFGHCDATGQPDTRFGSNGLTVIRHSTAVRLNRNALFTADGRVLLVGTGLTRNLLGTTSYGFLSALFRPDKPDSSSRPVTVSPNAPALAIRLQRRVLTIIGSNESDTIELSLASRSGSLIKAMLNGRQRVFNASGIVRIQIAGMDGDDYISLNDVSIRSIIRGGAGDDTITGGRGPDRILGDAGNDSIDGGYGSDYIAGGDGDDYLTGGVGTADRRDTVAGGAGDDTLQAGAGRDIVDGGQGSDLLSRMRAPNGHVLPILKAARMELVSR